jgi:phosphoadenosine phosphosulfate reductase
MFNLEWKNNNLLALSEKGSEKGEFFPVFFEELTILGLDKYWTFPKNVKAPLLWGRDVNQFVEYYYNGELVAKIKKGALYKEHSIKFVKEDLKLEPINIQKLLEANKPFLKDLVNEALDYINSEWKKLKRESYAFAVSYSGGKDSQVVLDLVLQVIPYKELFVIFTDTKMELPDTYQMVDWTENFYKRFYPDFKIHRVGSVFDTLELWRVLGPPSRIKRWCCSVYKIAPQIKFFEQISLSNPFKTIVVFEGTRAEESAKRSKYERTSFREKTFREINLKPIFYWNTFEVFLYHFYRGLKINPLYRKGFRRVGCSVCPFSSTWSEYLIQKEYSDHAKKFLAILENYAKNMGVANEEELKEYISSGAWKARAGGLGLESDTWVEIVKDGSQLKAVIKNCKEEITEWMKTAGKVHILEKDENSTKGELRVSESVIHFEIKKDGDKHYVEFKNVEPHPAVYKKLENVLYKSAYCVHCTGCEIECPYQAVVTYPKVFVDPLKCTHCGNCLEFIDRGCYAAESDKIVLGGGIKKRSKMKVNRYFTFGLRKPWLESFLERGAEWFVTNTLGSEQKKAMNNYLFDSELIDKKKNPTALFNILSKLLDKEPETVWQVVWVNLCIHSDLFKWYVTEIPWGKVWQKDELVEKLTEKGIAQRTARNAINALTNTFETSPLGNWFGKFAGKNKRDKRYYKAGTSDISIWALGYALYKLKELKGWKGTSVREIFELTDAGPYVWFGLTRDSFIKKLRSLKVRKLIGADLVADLDNIHFRDDIKPIHILERALDEQLG